MISQLLAAMSHLVLFLFPDPLQSAPPSTHRSLQRYSLAHIILFFKSYRAYLYDSIQGSSVVTLLLHFHRAFYTPVPSSSTMSDAAHVTQCCNYALMRLSLLGDDEARTSKAAPDTHCLAYHQAHHRCSVYSFF